MRVRDLDDADRSWVRRLLEETWGLPVVTPGGVYDAPEWLNGVVVEADGEPVGAVTYTDARVGDTGRLEWEVVTVHATRRGVGVGRLMMDEIRRRAVTAGAARVWLITTDDNVNAIGFYEHLGMTPVHEYPGFIDRVRGIKPYLEPATFDAAIEFEWRL